MRSFSRLPRKRPHGFTVLEILVTLAIVLVILLAALQLIGVIEQSWKTVSNDSFAEAQNALDIVAQNLSVATLESYEDYADASGSFRTNAAFVPDHLARRSDLDFICGPTLTTSDGTPGLLTGSGRITSGCGVFFIAPQGYSSTEANLGLERLLNTIGYFVEFGDDTSAPAFVLPSARRWRWRLKEVWQPSESLQVFTLSTSSAWVQQAAGTGTVPRILANNIISLIVLPERAANDKGSALSTDFRYDSRDASNPLTRHQLPPRARLALVAIDEASAAILANANGTNSPALVSSNLFQQAAQLDHDLATLDQTLTSERIGHRIFQREIQFVTAAWSNTP